MLRLILFLSFLVIVPLVMLNLDLSLSYEHVLLAHVQAPLLLSLSAFFFSFVTCYFIKRFEHLHARFSHDHDLAGIQKVHQIPVPRVGGLAIFLGLVLSFWVLSLFLGATGVRLSYLGLLLLASMPVFFAGLFEDLTKRVPARVRLLAAFISVMLGIALVHTELNRMDILWLDPLITWGPILYLWSIFVAGGTTHSFNLIDGYNGLASGVGVIILGAMGYLAYQIGDQIVLILSINVAMAVLGFMMWNWPKGRIFLGDGGAYLMGFLIASVGLILLDRNPSVSTWYFLALLGYPTFETIFSMYRRKFFIKARHDVPDDMHLHHLVYRRVVKLRGESPHLWIDNNSLSSVPLWLLMLLAAVVINHFYYRPDVLIWLYVAGVLGYKALYRTLKWLDVRDV